jgi:hypothetical protein
MLARSFITRYLAIMQFDTAHGGFTADLNKVLGGISMMAFAEIIPAGVGGIVTGVQTLKTATPNSFIRYAYQVRNISSDCNMSKIDLALCAFMALFSYVSATTDPTDYVAYESNAMSLMSLADPLVATEDGPDFLEAISFARARLAKLYSVHGQTTDLDRHASALLAAIAGIAGPILANVLPTLIKWVSSKFTSVEPNSFYAEFGGGINKGMAHVESYLAVQKAEEGKRAAELKVVQEANAILQSPVDSERLRQYAALRGGVAIPNGIDMKSLPKKGGPRRH